MNSQRKIDAARASGAKSRGPATPEGKAKCALNALKHGLTAKTVVLPIESEDAFNELHNALIAEFEPAAAVESLLVEEMAVAKWRSRRVWATESALYTLEMDLQHEQIAKDDTRITIELGKRSGQPCVAVASMPPNALPAAISARTTRSNRISLRTCRRSGGNSISSSSRCFWRGIPTRRASVPGWRVAPSGPWQKESRRTTSLSARMARACTGSGWWRGITSTCPAGFCRTVAKLNGWRHRSRAAR